MAEEQLALREWHTRARVRILEDHVVTSFSPSSPRRFRAGEVLTMLQWGREGNPVHRDMWWSSSDIDFAFLIPASKVEVIEILDEVSPF